LTIKGAPFRPLKAKQARPFLTPAQTGLKQVIQTQWEAVAPDTGTVTATLMP
jgi:hypothetical protein